VRRAPPIAWVGLALLLLGGPIAARAWVLAHRYESTDDAFVEGVLSPIAARVQGQVLEVPVEEHEAVKQGQLLVRLDPDDAGARVDRARAELTAAHNRMHAARAAAAAADAERKAAEVERWRTQRELERVQALEGRGAASSRDLDGARAAYDAAVARVRAATQRAEAERAVLGNEAPVRQAQAALRAAELDLAHTEVRAPFDGIVGRRNVEPGAIVSPGQTLLALASDAQGWVTANFKETQVGRMRVGSPAQVTIDALPGLVWRGHVESFSPATGSKYALIPPEPAAGNFTKVVQRLPVRVALDGLEEGPSAAAAFLPEGVQGPLPLGLSAHVRIAVH
jgi:membrane fusion protein (multidrug efflux system)